MLAYDCLLYERSAYLLGLSGRFSAIHVNRASRVGEFVWSISMRVTRATALRR